MKKMNNKGFLLTETLIVSTLLITVMLGLYTQFKSVNRKVNNSFNYDAVQSLYKVNELKKFLEQENFTSYINLLENSNYVDLTDCNSLYFKSYDYCKSIVLNAGVSTMLVTKENIYSLKKDVTLDDSLINYIKTIDYITADGYKLIVSFKDGTYGNVKIFNSDKYEVMIANSCNEYVNKSYTLSIKDNLGNHIIPNVVKEVPCNTTINSTDELEEIKSNMDSNTLNYLNTCFFNPPEYSKASFIVDGVDDNADITFIKGYSQVTFSYEANGTNISTNSIFTIPYCSNSSATKILSSAYAKRIDGYRYVSASVDEFDSNGGDMTITLYYEED